MGKDFEKKTNSRAYVVLKMIADAVILNLLFVLTTGLSAFVLFFPALVALTTCLNKMVNYEYYNPFLSFFIEIKEQWSFMWRLELLGMGVLLGLGGIGYLYYVYITNYGYTWIIWLAIGLMSSFVIVLIIIFMHLLVFNEYFKDDTFFMMIRKSAVIARRKPLISFLMFIIFLANVVVNILVPFLSIFISFSGNTIINLLICRNTYKKLSIEEEKRMAMGENLFLPTKAEDKEEQSKDTGLK